jgi:hypothetical protein
MKKAVSVAARCASALREWHRMPASWYQKKVSNQEYAFISQHGNGFCPPPWLEPAIKKLTRKPPVQSKRGIS